MAKDKKDTAIYTAYEDWEELDTAKPEKGLLVAILLGAIGDLSKDRDSARKAQRYFLSEEEEYLFSFRSVCNHLNIDPKKILTLTGVKSGRAPNISKINKILDELTD